MPVTIPVDLTATNAAIAVVDANVDAVLVDTGTTIPATIATVDSNVDAILVDTGTTIPGLVGVASGSSGAMTSVNMASGIGYHSVTAGAYTRQAGGVLRAGSDFDGTLRFSCLGYVGGGTTLKVRVYRNGAGVGTEMTESSGVPWTAMTDSISGWADGDEVEVFMYRSAGGSYCYGGGISFQSGGGWSIGQVY